MKATLEFEHTGRFGRGYVRFYRLSEPIKYGKSDWEKEPELLTQTAEMYLRMKSEETRAKMRPVIYNEQGIDLVCISDAWDHAERLVFPAYDVPEQYRKGTDKGYAYGFYCADIGGKHTLLIDGGDPSTMMPPEHYLRELAELNGLEWEGIITGNNKPVKQKEE